MKQENQPDPPRPGSLSSGTAGVRHFNQILMMAMMMMAMMMMAISVGGVRWRDRLIPRDEKSCSERRFENGFYTTDVATMVTNTRNTNTRNANMRNTNIITTIIRSFLKR